MSSRVKSLLATALIQAVLAYALILGLARTIPRHAPDKLSVVELVPEPPPPPPPVMVLPPKTPPLATRRPPPVAAPGADWATAGAAERDIAFAEIHKWVQDNLPEKDRRLARWRGSLPQGSGAAKVTRLQPPNLTTHTLYWPAGWSKGPLPIVAWGNGFDGQCTNSSLPYAAFLSEIASHGYFVVAVGNDDIDYPQPEGLAVLPDGRPLRTQASALRKAVDWAIAENGRAGSPYAGRLDTGKIAYVGHGCGGGLAIEASSDPRTTTTVVLNAAARLGSAASGGSQASLAQFEGSKDDRSVLEAGETNLERARAAGRPMFKAALDGMGYDGAYAGPDRRWSKAVLAWLDWQLKGDSKAAAKLTGLARDGWSRIGAVGLTPAIAAAPATPPTP